MTDKLIPPKEPLAVQRASPRALERAPAGAALPVTAIQSLELGTLFDKAMALPDGADKLEKLVDLAMKIEDRQGRQIFNTQLLEFQQRCPKIPKGGLIKFTKKDGTGKVETPYPRLHEDIEPAIRPLLQELGFSYIFSQTLSPKGDLATVTCTLSHIAGHERTSAYTTTTRTTSPAITPQQAVAGADTNAKRRCLMAVLGLPIESIAGLDAPPPEPRASDAEYHEFLDFFEDVHPEETRRLEAEKRILHQYQVRSLSDLTSSEIAQIMEMYEERLRQKGN